MPANKNQKLLHPVIQKCTSLLITASILISGCQSEATYKTYTDTTTPGCVSEFNIALIVLENYIDQLLHRDHLDILAKMSPDELNSYDPSLDRRFVLSVWHGVRKLQADQAAINHLKKDALAILRQEARIDLERLKKIAERTYLNLKEVSMEKKLSFFQHLLGIDKKYKRLTQKDLIKISEQKLSKFNFAEAMMRYHAFDQRKLQGFFIRSLNLKGFRVWIKYDPSLAIDAPDLAFEELSLNIMRSQRNSNGQLEAYPSRFSQTPDGYRQLIRAYLAGSSEDREALAKYTLLMYEAFMSRYIVALTPQAMAKSIINRLPYIDTHWRTSKLIASESLSPEVAQLMPLLLFTSRLMTQINISTIIPNLSDEGQKQIYFLTQLILFDIFSSPDETIKSLIPQAVDIANTFKTSTGVGVPPYGGHIIVNERGALEGSSPEQTITSSEKNHGFLRKLAIISAALGLISVPTGVSLGVVLSQ